MTTLASDWTSPLAESAWYQITLAGGRREVCRTDGSTFLHALVQELDDRLASFPEARPPLDWDGARVLATDLSTGDPTWSIGVLRALYAVLTADGAASAAAQVRRDAAAGQISEATLRAAIWEVVPTVVRDAATGEVLPAIVAATGARRRASGSGPSLVRLPPRTTLPVFGVAPPVPFASSGEVCGEPTPGRDLDAVQNESFFFNPLFLFAAAAATLVFASAVGRRLPRPVRTARG